MTGPGGRSGELDDYLRFMPVTGEAVRFDLYAFRSTVTREMLQVRVRMTAQAFGVGTDLVAANVTGGGARLEVDAGGLATANDAARARLEAGPEGAVGYLRDLSAVRTSVDRIARRPGPGRLLAYVAAAARYQALGALKFCLPEMLRPTLAAWMGDPALVDALLAPEEPSLWSVLNGRELALARLRARGPAALYRQRLVLFQRAYGYLYAEDVDFRDHETIEAIDGRLADRAADVVGQRRRLAEAWASDRAQKANARRVFAEALEGRDDVLTLVSHVLLARALTAHEDLNRRAKMRFLRDLRDLADRYCLDLEHDGLAEFASRCAGAAVAATGDARPVLRSV